MYLELKRCLENTVQTGLDRKLGYKSKYSSHHTLYQGNHRIYQSNCKYKDHFISIFIYVECIEQMFAPLVMEF